MQINWKAFTSTWLSVSAKEIKFSGESTNLGKVQRRAFQTFVKKQKSPKLPYSFLNDVPESDFLFQVFVT